MPSNIPLLAVAPHGALSPEFFIAVAQAGALPVVDMAPGAARAFAPAHAALVAANTTFGARVTDAAAIPAGASVIVIAHDAPALAQVVAASRAAHPSARVFAECVDVARIQEADATNVDAIIVKGREGAGRVGVDSTVTLLLRARATSTKPILVQGGVGPRVLAGALAAGASGAVLDSQLYAARDGPLTGPLRAMIAATSAGDSAIVGDTVDAAHRILARRGTPILASLRKAEREGVESFNTALAAASGVGYATMDPRASVLSVGMDGGLAGALASRHTSVSGIITFLWTDALSRLGRASRTPPPTASTSVPANASSVSRPADVETHLRSLPVGSTLALVASEAPGPSDGIPVAILLEETLDTLEALARAKRGAPLTNLAIVADLRGALGTAFIQAATSVLVDEGVTVTVIADPDVSGASVAIATGALSQVRVESTPDTMRAAAASRVAVRDSGSFTEITEAAARFTARGAHEFLSNERDVSADAARAITEAVRFHHASVPVATPRAAPRAAPVAPAARVATAPRADGTTDPLIESVAIVGYAGIFPGARTTSAYWENILAARNLIIDVPDGRWDTSVHFDADPSAPDKTYAKIGGFVTDFKFESARFRIPPSTAKSLDGVQQWTLTVAAEALAHAGYEDREFDRARCAVILGNSMGGEIQHAHNKRVFIGDALKAVRKELPASMSDGERNEFIARAEKNFKADLPSITEDTMPGELANVIAGRVANVLDLGGKNFTTDAACASSLAALDAACRGLTSNEYDMVLCGGADRSMDPATYVKFSKIGALSADGSRPFDAGANGFVMGEGAGVIVLKRLADAIRDGDTIHAVVRGVGSSSDGRGKGITAPNPEGQRRAVSRALSTAQIAPKHVQLIEAHGTSTRVGDVVELEVLSGLYAEMPAASIAIGSVKSQIGHLKSAAGIAGLLKATLALKHGILPPSANFVTPNPNIAWDKIPFYVNTTPTPWASPANGEPRRAAVSAFGFGGTNFHAILESYVPAYHARVLDEAPVAAPTAAPVARAPVVPAVANAPEAGAPELPILVLAGADLNAVIERARALVAPARAGAGDFEHFLRTHRDAPGPARLAIVATDFAALADRLEIAVAALPVPAKRAMIHLKGIFYAEGATPGPVAFVFPGQGSQYANMLGDVALAHPVARATFAEADAVLEPLIGRKLTSLLFADPNDADAVARSEGALRETEITQPAMLAADVAILRVLDSYGIKPDAVAGHSLGEYAALVAAGVLSFADALHAVSARGKEMANVHVPDKGKMASIAGDAVAVERILASVEGYVVAANKNAPNQTVIAGATVAVEAAMEACKAAGLTVIPLNVSAAFHSEIVAPASDPLGRLLANLDIKAPRIPVIANVNAEPYPAERDAIVSLLAKQVAAPVEWERSVRLLASQGFNIFVESGPKRALTGLIGAILGDDAHAVLTNHPKKGGEASLAEAIARLAALGVPVKLARENLPQAPVAAAPARVATGPSAAPVQRPSEIPLARTDAATGSVAAAMKPHLDALVAAVEAEVGAARSVESRIADLGIRLDDVVVTGAALGLPGRESRVFDDGNFDRLARGENRIDRLSAEDEKRFVEKGIVRLVKDDGDARFETITDAAQVIKLAARRGAFDISKEYGLDANLVADWDITTKLAIAAGLDALRDAGIPLIREELVTTKNTRLPGGWKLPESMRADTGIVFASAFPGYDNLVQDVSRHLASQYANASLGELTDLFTDLIQEVKDTDRRARLVKWFAQESTRLGDAPSSSDVEGFSRKFLFRVLAFGHAQFAELVGARGPNLQVNAACASTAAAIAVAEDWIRAGRAARVIVIAADDATSENLLEWIGSGFLASGAATTAATVEEGALPFDKRRHGMIVGMGAAGIVLERADAAEARACKPIARLVATRLANSAHHGSRLDVEHIAGEVETLIGLVSKRVGKSAAEIGRELVFLSHETYTPPRGGSASAEMAALRRAFGASVRDVLVTNVKGFTGHPMGAGLEDVIAVKALQYKRVPPVANLKERDPEFADLNLATGGTHDRKYALRLAAGFGSQIALVLFESIALGNDRITDPAAHANWLTTIAGGVQAELAVENRTLKLIKAASSPVAPAAPRPIAQVAAPTQVTSPTAAPPALVAANATDVLASLTALVAEKTGYPAEALEPDLDLEADLGIDTVKQAEVFGMIREKYTLPREDGVRIKDYPTLGKIAEYVVSRLSAPAPAQAPASPAPAAASTPAPVAAAPAPVGVRAAPRATPTPGPDDGEDPLVAVTALVAEKTGYPVEALEPDLDLEADLGIDTVKQAELFGMVREKFAIPRTDGLKLKDYPTLAKIAEFVRDNRALANASPAPNDAADSRPSDAVAQPARVMSLVDAPFTLAAPGVAAEPVAVIGEGARAKALTRHFNAGAPEGAATLIAVTDASSAADVNALFLLARAQAERLEAGIAFVLVVPRDAPWTESARGLARGLAREFPASKVRALETDAPAAEVPQQVLALLASDAIDVSITDGHATARRARIIDSAESGGVPAKSGDTVLAIGGGAGITAACALELARGTSGLKFILAGRTPLIDDAASYAHVDDAALKALQADASARIKARNERATPVAVQREIAPLLRAGEVARTLAALQQAGAASTTYVACDVGDAESVARLASTTGPVDIVIHGAGIEESRRLAEKDADAFMRTAKPKAIAAENLASAYADARLVFFGSVAGEFGNATQADYSAANAHLLGLAKRLRGRGRDARVMSWTAWREIGMATRGSTLTVLDALGVEALTTAEGTRAFLTSLGGAPRDVVIVKSLGPLEPERAPDAPVARRVDTLDGSASTFLKDHAVSGTPYLPGVAGVARFERLARESGLEGDARVDAVRFGYPVKFLKGPIDVTADVQASGAAFVGKLTTVPPGPKPEPRTHFTATVRADASTLPDVPSLVLETPLAWTKSDIYARYFHGPSFQVLDSSTAVAPRGIRVEARPPEVPLDDPAVADDVDLASRALALESALQAAGLHAWAVLGVSGLPHALDGVRVRAFPASLTARLIDEVDGLPSYEVWGVDANGATVLHVARLTLIPIGDAPRDTIPSTPLPVERLNIASRLVLSVDADAVATALGEDAHAFSTLLSGDESATLASFENPKRAADWCAGALAAKAALAALEPGTWRSHVLKRADDAAREPENAAHGITLSHAAGLAVATAWNTGAEIVGVGIDVDEVRPRDPAFREEAFNEGERARIKSDADATRAWCLKEALLKSLRVGLSVDLHSVTVELAGRAPSFDLARDVKAAYAQLGAPRVDVGEAVRGKARIAVVALVNDRNA